MQDKHWEKFYKEKKAPQKQSKFAEAVDSFFIDELKKRGLTILDMGAGNGRDTKYLSDSSLTYSVIGIDKNIENDYVDKASLQDVVDIFKSPDIVYSRFFLHSITNKKIINLIEWTDNYFVAEFRIKGDKPVIYQDHKRNLINLGWLINKLLENNFEILKLKVGRGMAKYKNEDPLVARVYARKIKK